MDVREILLGTSSPGQFIGTRDEKDTWSNLMNDDVSMKEVGQRRRMMMMMMMMTHAKKWQGLRIEKLMMRVIMLEHTSPN